MCAVGCHCFEWSSINSGNVVVGSFGPKRRLKYAVVGDTVNIAARLEKYAEPGTAVLGGNTFDLLDDGFACEDLGSVMVKGREQPVRVYSIRP